MKELVIQGRKFLDGEKEKEKKEKKKRKKIEREEK